MVDSILLAEPFCFVLGKEDFVIYLDIFFNSGGLAILLVIISFFFTLCDDENRTSTEQEYSQIVIVLPAKIVI